MIIGLCGSAGSGKDTVADFLVEAGDCVKVALADEIKRICARVFDFSEDQLWGSSEMRNAPDKRYPREHGYLTPRFALQQLGTNWGRDCYSNVWVDLTLRTAARVLSGDGYFQDQGLVRAAGGDCQHVVIPDVRFRNEVGAIHAAGGVVWRITREGAGLKGVAGQHVSETEQASIPEGLFSHIIDNSGTRDQLRDAVLTLAVAP